MSILIVQNLEEPQGLVLGERVLIGRRPFNTIMVPDPDVSRIHAWIGQREGGYHLFDAGSRAGTWVNDQKVIRPHVLAEGDVIRIGPATILYSDAAALPGDIPPLQSPPVPPTTDPYDGGIYFDCACGGPMWVAAEWAGKMGKCRYCGRRLVVPHRSGNMARPQVPTANSSEQVAPPPKPQARAPRRSAPRPPTAPLPAPLPNGATAEMVVASPSPAASASVAPSPHVPEALCSICQTPIQNDEERISCPSCHLTFHAGCWQENYGCSAYGCDQVNVLAPAEAVASQTTMGSADAVATPAYDQTFAAAPARFPWEPVLLALSFVAMALGALAFGIPSAIMLIVVLAFLVIGRPRRKGWVIAALIVTLVGAAAGYAMSMLWWKGLRVWETFLK
jgi:hypothetical protein